jgi:cytochrome c556
MRKMKTIVAATAVGIVAASVVWAQRISPDQAAVGFRQGLMSVINGIAVPLQQTGRGRTPYDAATVKKAADRLIVLTDIVPEAFERDTSAAADIKTQALPAVWKNHAEFVSAAADLKKATENLAQTVKGGDEAAIKAAINSTGETCGACHMKFREGSQ